MDKSNSSDASMCRWLQHNWKLVLAHYQQLTSTNSTSVVTYKNVFDLNLHRPFQVVFVNSPPHATFQNKFKVLEDLLNQDRPYRKKSSGGLNPWKTFLVKEAEL